MKIILLREVVRLIDTARMSPRGQIVIPKSIRDYVGAGNESIFAVSALDRDTVVMRRLDTDKLVSEFRTLRKRAQTLSRREIEAEINATRRARH
jgi:bifunctional DNA-binding transcriptional regulator/antitoxin component of YhaV-PrlF toxin-antitoxin module